MLQNVGFSLLIIGVLIPLAALGVLGLATVVVVHESAEVLVILNAIRAARVRTLPGLTSTPAATGRVHVTVAAPEPVDLCCATVPASPTADRAVSPGDPSDDGCAGGCECCGPRATAAAPDRGRGSA